MLTCKQCSKPAFMLDNHICEECDRINEWEGSNIPTVPGRASKRPLFYYSDISNESPAIVALAVAIIQGNEKRAQA
jgi:hypothetical protein